MVSCREGLTGLLARERGRNVGVLDHPLAVHPLQYRRYPQRKRLILAGHGCFDNRVGRCCPCHIPGGRDAYFSEPDLKLIGLLEVPPQQFGDFPAADDDLVSASAKQEHITSSLNAAA